MYVHVFAFYCKQAQYALIAALKATRDMPTSPLTSALALSLHCTTTTTSTYQCVCAAASCCREYKVSLSKTSQN